MALFGFHLVLTMIAAVIFSKTAQCQSLCDLLFFKGLDYFLLESSVLSKSNAIESYNKRKRKKEKDFRQNEDEYRLIRLPLSCAALHRAPFFDSLILITNYSLFSIFIYLISDTFCLLFPENKAINTSSIWVVGALFLQIHILVKISLKKITVNELLSERNVLLCASALFFLAAIAFCAFCNKIIDLSFERGYAHFVASLDHFLFSNGFGHLFSAVDSHSPIMLMVSLSLLYSIIASSMFFPLLQYSSLYIHSGDRSVPIRLLLHAAFFAPLLIVLLYLRPIADHLIENTYLSFAHLRVLRFVCVCLWVVLRIITAKSILQTFLNQPKSKISDYTREQEENCQRKVVYFASYACVTSLQYLLPVLITFSITLLLKNSDGFTLTNSKMDHESILNVVLSYELQEPIWKCSLILLLCTQIFVGMIGVIGERTFC